MQIAGRNGIGMFPDVFKALCGQLHAFLIAYKAHVIGHDLSDGVFEFAEMQALRGMERAENPVFFLPQHLFAAGAEGSVGVLCGVTRRVPSRRKAAADGAGKESEHAADKQPRHGGGKFVIRLNQTAEVKIGKFDFHGAFFKIHPSLGAVFKPGGFVARHEMILQAAAQGRLKVAHVHVEGRPAALGKLNMGTHGQKMARPLFLHGMILVHVFFAMRIDGF